MAKSSVDFEKNFADLAYTYINNNAPKLLDYMVGFQVLDHDEDESKAVGLFGFAIGGRKKEMFYAPIFFISGKLKGQELLYNGQADMFIPLEEAWVDFILNKKPVELGQISDNSRGYLSRFLPNFRDMLGKGTSTLYKGASAAEIDDPDAPVKLYGNTILGAPFDITPALSMFVEKDMDKTASLALPDSVRDSTALLHAVATRMYQYPEFAKMACAFYDVTDFVPDEVDDAVVQTVKAAKAPPVLEKRSSAHVVSGDAVVHMSLTPEQKRDYTKSGFIVVDERPEEEKSQLLDGDMAFSAPSSTGFYDIIFADQSIKRCLVLRRNRRLGPSQFLVYDPDEGALWEQSSIYAMTDSPVEDFSSRDVLEPVSGNHGYNDYLVSPNGEAYALYGMTRIIESERVQDIVDAGGDVFIVPKGKCRLLAPKRSSFDGKSDLVPPSTEAVCKLADIFGSAVIKAASAGGSVIHFRQGKGCTTVHSRIEAMKYLVEDLGLSKASSEYVLSTVIEDSFHDFIVKRAYADYIGSYDPEAPDVSMEDIYSGSDPWSGAMMTENYSQDAPVMGLPLNSTSDYGEMDPDIYGTMQKAVATKQKDVFDVAALSSLLKSTNMSNLIDKYIPDLIKAVDKIGRSLFLLYTDPEGFKERYGDADLSELEDALSNAFTTVGNLVLFLKKRSIAADIDDQPVEL